jgi:uncharacterized protein YecT (DUF1311 family)
MEGSMLKAFSALSILLALFPISSYSQEPKKHPIDKALENCIDKNPSTAGETDCAEKALEMWDKELNKNYRELLAKLDPKDKAVLKAAQTEWIKYRDEEYKLTDAIYSKLQGSMYTPMAVHHRVGIVKQRAEALKFYIELLKDQ